MGSVLGLWKRFFIEGFFITVKQLVFHGTVALPFAIGGVFYGMWRQRGVYKDQMAFDEYQESEETD